MFKSFNVKVQKRVLIIAFLVVPVFLMLLFSYYPAVKLFQQSFTNWDGVSPTYKYIGFKNYISVFTDTSSLKALLNNGAYLVGMFIQTAIALYLAIILNAKLKARNFFKSIVFMPYVLNGVAVAFMFNYIYDYNKGPLNVLLKSIGLGNYVVHWLPNSYFINISLAIIGVWQYTGLSMVLFLGALQSIPNDIYEAASLDGANFFQTVRYIIIPNIKRVLELVLFTGISGSLQAYFQPYVITKGGPAGMSDTFVTKLLSVAFQFQNFGKASAMSVVLLLFVVALIGVQKLFLGRKEE
ncbi:carbohydrate ABC transporter permease [Clostridium felsineum]|uniref:carbohydrate ABC transporter permease n=1 Tax=Clostridium felsineum TaxID=36839 RepID=UPI00098C2240|nr:sugar ABC transporter permease [Clostridium felsineum]URZ18272.1 Diacetylchitobiose uptake system permease protein NgcF [Clostridium felsineum DSM 794]